jgi:DNA-binding MarR family transcriptional regulator
MTPARASADRPGAAGRAHFPPERLRGVFHRKALADENLRLAVARSLGIDRTEAAALAHFAQHGELTPGQLGTLLGLTSGGTTAIIHRLLEAGNLERHPHPRDRRSSVLTLSPSMLRRAEGVYAPLVDHIDALADQLTESECALIGRHLTLVAEAIERHARLLVSTRNGRRVAADSAPRLWT